MLDYIKENTDITKYLYFRIKTYTKYFVEIDEKEKLIELFTWINTNKIKFFILGGGSNVLFKNNFFDGIVIKISNNKNLIGFNNEGLFLIDSGYLLSKFLNYIEKLNFFTSHLQGIPGSIGGAIACNAGSINGSISDHLVNALIFDIEKLQFFDVDKSFFQFDYRNSIIKSTQNKYIIWSAILKMYKKNVLSNDIIQKYNAHIKSKKELQSKIEGYNAGCFFKNPSIDKPAGKLIDECGLKGYQIGDAMISNHHANFIINKGNATSDDILKLSNIARQKVKEKFNIDLEEEIVIVE